MSGIEMQAPCQEHDHGWVTPMMAEIRRGEWDRLIEYLVFPGEWEENGQSQFRIYPIDTYLACELRARRFRLVRGEADHA